MMTWLLHSVTSEVRNLPTYDGLNEVDIFFDAFEKGRTRKSAILGLGIGTERYARKMVGYAQGKI